MASSEISSEDARLCEWRLKEILRPLVSEGLIVAFSGGVDSTYLLAVAQEVLRDLGSDVQSLNGSVLLKSSEQNHPFDNTKNLLPRLLAVTAVSPSMASWERSDALHWAQVIGAEHYIESSKELENPAYQKNDGTRCYYCKSELFSISFRVAIERGFKHVAYGYNASDRADDRPGHRAAKEYSVHAPLAEAQLTKEMIRQNLAQRGMALSDKPASPCLASRLVTGVTVTEKRLSDVEVMESLMRGAGLTVFRVRVHEQFLRIEVAPDQMTFAFSIKDELVAEGKKLGYRWVTLDLAGYQMGGANA